MEQRIEIFRGKEVRYSEMDTAAHYTGNAFIKAKKKSEQLLKEGWFIQEMVSQYFEQQNGGESQLMVVYRRKA